MKSALNAKFYENTFKNSKDFLTKMGTIPTLINEVLETYIGLAW